MIKQRLHFSTGCLLIYKFTVMRFFINQKHFLLAASLLFASGIIAQSDWRNWYEASFGIAFSKKIDVSLSHLRSYDVPNSFHNNFNESSVDVSYYFTKNFFVRSGFSLTELPKDRITTNKYFSRLGYKIPIAKILHWSNSLQGEINTVSGQANTYRFIYITRLVTSHRLKFLKLSPSVSYWLFYTKGGKAIQYFDDAGSPLVKDTPDGLHRGRFVLNLNTKLSSVLSLSLFYINQKEFNLSGRDINVVNPRNGKVARPFRDYQVAGINLSFSFKVYKNRSNQ